MTLRELYLEVQKQNPKALDFTICVTDWTKNELIQEAVHFDIVTNKETILITNAG